MVLTLLFSFSCISVFSQSKTAYHIGKTFHIESSGGYDYLTVDSASNNLYISHGSQVNQLAMGIKLKRVTRRFLVLLPTRVGRSLLLVCTFVLQWACV